MQLLEILELNIKEKQMTYFARPPELYGTPSDRWLKSQIETTFGDAVKTPEMKHYGNLLVNFNAMHECEIGVFQPITDMQWDESTLNQMVCMAQMGKPVYSINTEGKMMRIVKINLNK